VRVRKDKLLEAAYAYVLEHGLADLSLRPLAAAIGSSPRVLLYLFESKDGLVRALLERARSDELELLDRVRGESIDEVARQLWGWLATPAHGPLLVLWTEAYARSLVDPHGPWHDFGRDTVRDWLDLLAAAQPPAVRNTPAGEAHRTLLLAGLRGALLDLLATGDRARSTAAVDRLLGSP
jgi:AcrR family transcriptional regulator